MKLNNREKAWQNRKEPYKESHPTYSQWGKYAYYTLTTEVDDLGYYTNYVEER